MIGSTELYIAAMRAEAESREAVYETIEQIRRLHAVLENSIALRRYYRMMKQSIFEESYQTEILS